jgi:pimeloyl-ACP methyl ester carboxylesterase
VPADFWPKRTPHTTSLGTRNSTTYQRLVPTGANYDLRPVIHLHGWPQDGTAAQTLAEDTASEGSALRLLLASGRVVYRPFTGSNFGADTATWPSMGGTGLVAVDDMIEQANADGLDTTRIDLWGISMGGCNALNWAYRNASQVNRIYLSMPGLDFGTLWDFGSTLRTCLETVHGAVGRAPLLAATTERDPVQMDFSTIANRIAGNIADDDSLINYASASAWMATWDVPHTVTSGNHFAYTEPWSETQPYRWLLGHDLEVT